ncbi:MAG: fused MFS/spermidine synthase [Gemmatimonadota bacterium]
MSRRRGLFALAFGSGFAVLVIEIAGARLIAPVYGLSVVPWTAVIGVILGALAVGSHVGGRLADAGKIPLSRLLILAGLTGVLPILGGGVPIVARSILGFIPGAVASAMILFAPPVFCLGAVVPYLVQADTESLDTIGRRAGDLSAAATAGSICGSFCTGFLLLPAMPVTVLLGVTSAVLLMLAVAADRLLRTKSTDATTLGAVVLLPLLGFVGAASPADSLFNGQSLYASISVTERTWPDDRRVRELWQNGGSSSAEYVDDGTPAHIYALTSLALLDSLGLRPERSLVLGGAALTLPVALHRGTSRTVDVVEIDPEVTRLAEEFFVYGREPFEGIRVIHDDARVVLRESEVQYDLVYLDVFDHLVTVPWTMVTREALTDMSRRLSDEGVFMANVLSPLEGSGTAFLARLTATLTDVFDDVRLYRAAPELDLAATQNLIVVARPGPGLRIVAWEESPVRPDGRPLTDAWAPVEYLQARVFLDGLRWR